MGDEVFLCFVVEVLGMLGCGSMRWMCICDFILLVFVEWLVLCLYFMVICFFYSFFLFFLSLVFFLYFFHRPSYFCNYHHHFFFRFNWNIKSLVTKKLGGYLLYRFYGFGI